MKLITGRTGTEVRVERSEVGASSYINVGGAFVQLTKRETERLIEALQETLKEPVFHYKIKQNIMEVFEVENHSAYLNCYNGLVSLSDKFPTSSCQTQFTRAEFAELIDKGSIYYGLFEEEEV